MGCAAFTRHALLLAALGALCWATRGVAGVDEANEAQIEKALDLPVTLNVQAVPLDRVVTQLAEQFKIPIHLERRHFAELGAKPDAPITLRASGVTLRSALHLLLNPDDLGWAVVHGVLLVTTREQEDQIQEPRCYNVLDLVAIGPGSSADRESSLDYDSVAEAIMSCTEPTSWDSGSGPAIVWMTPFRGTLVFTQTPRVHRQCAELLAAVRAVREKRNGLARIGGDLQLQNDARLRELLEESVEIDAANQSLDEFLSQLAQRYHVNICIDRPGLKEAGVEIGTPVTLRLAAVSLKAALALVLEPLDLRAMVYDEVVWVTTKDRAPLTTVVYWIGDIASQGHGVDAPDFEQVFKEVFHYERDTGWTTARLDDLIVCRCREYDHDRIVALLAEVRAQLKQGEWAAACIQPATATIQPSVLWRLPRWLRRR